METLLTPQDGDEAYRLVSNTREWFDDRTSIEPIQREFPWHFRQDAPYHLLRAGDNKAGTFKLRGALVGAVALRNSGVEKVILPSAGNHARGGLLAAHTLGMHAHVVVPHTAPPQ